MSDEAPPKYPPTLHLNGSGVASRSPRLEWLSLDGRNVVIEEKVDGTQAAFWFDAGGGLHVGSRGSEADQSSREFAPLAAWVGGHEAAFLDRIEDRYVVYGEWTLFAHSVFYDRLPAHFLEFDVFDRATGEFLSTPRRRELLEGLPVHSVPVLYEGPADPARHPSALVARSQFKSEDWRKAAEGLLGSGGIEDCDLPEGVYGKVEEDGRVVIRFKWIREAFVRHIVDGGSHWKSRNPVRNGLAEGLPSRVPALRG